MRSLDVTRSKGSPGRPRPRRRRPAGVASSWTSFYLACGFAIVLALAVIASAVWRRADSALADIQQEDPRLRATSTLTVLPSVTPRRFDAAVAQPTTAPAATPAIAPTLASIPDSLREPFSILLIGVDRRADELEGVRSDTLILVRVDPEGHWASMISIPRDSVVQVPNLGWSKINAAYSFGFDNAEALYGAGTDPSAAGAASAAATVEQFLGVAVDYTAQVDFHGFEQLVDTLGGIVVDVPTPLLDGEYPTENYGYQRIYIASGLQTLDGRTALIYARTRHASSDFERGKRQQQVLRALLEQARDRGLLENAALLPQWAGVLRQNVRTTLPIRDFAFLNGLALLARDLRTDSILQLSINPNDVAIDHEDGSDIYWNAADLAILVERWKTGPTP
jgi:LCP family protein required for cell wall assembly